MTEYERGFNDGFTEAVSRIGKGPSGSTWAGHDDGLNKKIAVGFRPDQFTYISQYARNVGSSFAGAVRQLIDTAVRTKQ